MAAVSPQPLNVLVAIGDGTTVIVTVPRDATVLQLKQAVQQQRDGAKSYHDAILSNGGRQWPDDQHLFDMDGAEKDVIKVLLSSRETGTGHLKTFKAKPIVKVARTGDELNCTLCFKPSTHRCATCNKVFCSGCMNFKPSTSTLLSSSSSNENLPSSDDDKDARKKRVTFASSTAIPMDCKMCARAIKPPALFDESATSKWEQNRWYILIIVAIVVIVAIILNVNFHH